MPEKLSIEDTSSVGIEISSQSEIAMRHKLSLLRRIEDTITSLNSLREDLEHASRYDPQTIVNGRVEAALHNILSSEGPGNY